MRFPALTIMLLLSVLHATAQETTSAFPLLSNQPDGACIRATDEKAWNAIRLTTDQLRKVRATQAEFVQADDLITGADSTASADSTRILDTHRELIKAVLTEVQYQNWVKWCIERTMDIELKE